MMQGNLFRPTSQQTRESIADAPRVREMIWAFLEREGDRGGTDAEIQEALGIDGNTERPKRLELFRAGQIHDSGRTRPTPSGRDAIVWVTTKFRGTPDAPKPSKQNRLPPSPDRQRLAERAADRERMLGPALDGMPAEELEGWCVALPGWPRLFGKTYSPETARLDPVCRRLLLAALEAR